MLLPLDALYLVFSFLDCVCSCKISRRLQLREEATVESDETRYNSDLEADQTAMRRLPPTDQSVNKLFWARKLF